MNNRPPEKPTPPDIVVFREGTDPTKKVPFAECEHSYLRCEKCKAISSPHGWSAFTDRDELQDEVEQLRTENANLQAQLLQLQATVRDCL